jgi:ribosomal protein S12
VLSKFTPEEEQIVDEKALVAIDAIKAFALSGIQFAMCNYNNK